MEDLCGTDRLLRKTSDRLRLVLVVWLFGVSITWCILRSTYVEWGATDLSEQNIPLLLRGVVFAAFALPTIAVIFRPSSLLWLLGLSATVGTIPQLPLVPFLHEYAHMVIVLGVVPLVVFGRFREWTFKRFGSRIYAAYIATCLLSTVVNWLISKNIWQMKVGIAFLILFSCFAAFIISTSEATKGRDITFSEMLNGFVWGIFAQGVIAFLAFPLLLMFQAHEGNDTVFGLAYYERYKSTFPGPVNLGMFVVVSMPLVLLWMNRHAAKSWIALTYLQFLPWVVIISGSRTARGVGLFVLLLTILRRETRMTSIAILPSALAASYIGFFYNSFPAALRALFGDDKSTTLSFKGHFFDLSDRTGLVAQTETWLTSGWQGVGGWFHTIFGFGAGVGGYVQSGFPSPHTMVLNLIVDTGAVGLLLYACFSAWLLMLLLNQSFRDKRDSLKSWTCFIVLCSALIANSTYVPHLWGFYMVTIIFSCAALHFPIARGPFVADMTRAASIKRALVRSVFGSDHLWLCPFRDQISAWLVRRTNRPYRKFCGGSLLRKRPNSP